MKKIIVLLALGLMLMAFNPIYPETDEYGNYHDGDISGVATRHYEDGTLMRDCDADGVYSKWIKYEGWEFDSVYMYRVQPAWAVCEGYEDDEEDRRGSGSSGGGSGTSPDPTPASAPSESSPPPTSEGECLDGCPPGCICENGYCVPDN